jgi:glycerol-3-phosphate dehydrogenase (NAD(P)+)
MEYKIGNETRCAVIGYGSWATAIVGLLTANETRVGWYVRNPEVLEGLLTEGRNPRYLSDMEFDRDRIAPSDDLDGSSAKPTSSSWPPPRPTSRPSSNR